MDKKHGINDISAKTKAEMIADCEVFQKEHADLLASVGDEEQNGHDFWLTRNHHGAGFWDRGYGEAGEKLTALSHGYGSYSLYVGDDKKIYSL